MFTFHDSDFWVSFFVWGANCAPFRGAKFQGLIGSSKTVFLLRMALKCLLSGGFRVNWDYVNY
jgi:hypothetical protein